METQKQVLPFEIKEPQFDENGGFADVSSYLSAVKKESDSNTGLFFKSKQKLSNSSNNLSDSLFEPKEVSEDFIEFENWRVNFIKYFKSEKQKYNFEEYKVGDEADIDLEILPTSFTQWRLFMINNEPNKKLLDCLSQAMILKLIIYLKKLIDTSMKGYMDLWILKLFLRLDDVLNYNDIHELREVSKRMLQLRKNENKLNDEKSKLSCNMIIAIVYDIYGQKDLYI